MSNYCPRRRGAHRVRHGGLIEKTRLTVPWRGHEWEVDAFAGENVGLVIAEIELRQG
jgi:CYTH domain-containing protein